MIIEQAPPKVNLTLDITGRREDGYHLLHSLVVFPGGGDELSFEPSKKLELTVSGPFSAGLPTSADNLVVQIAAYLRSYFHVTSGANIHLTKNLPVASGIGGGSADAAATLRGLNKLWDLGLGRERLQEIGALFGADIPVCVKSVPCFMEGVGEKLSDQVVMPGLGILLVNPGVSVATPLIFSKLNYPKGEVGDVPEKVSRFGDTGSLIAYLKARFNDLQSPAVSLVSEIANVLDVLEGSDSSLFHRMSGSGATCFALYPSYEIATTAASAISSAHPDWWVHPASLNRGG